VTVSWSALQGALDYEYAVNNSYLPPSSGASLTSTTFTESNLLPNTTYYAHVRSRCAPGNFSPWDTIAIATLPPPVICIAPSNVSSSGVTSNTAIVMWSAITGCLGYEYVLNTSSSAPSGSGTPFAPTSFHANNLTPSTNYYFHVRTVCP